MRKISFIFIIIITSWGCSHLNSPSLKFQSENRGSGKSDSQPVNSVATSSSKTLNLSWPVSKIKINRGFKIKPKHHGIDLGGKKNTPIYAAHEGTVVYVGRKFRGYGKMILVEFDKQWATLYSHLNGYNVKIGDKVKRGELIGKMGRTGRATGVHLHFELLKNKTPIDPLNLLPNSHLAKK